MAFWTTYRAAHRELDELYAKIEVDTRKVRLITLVWLRAHQKMASGVGKKPQFYIFRQNIFRLEYLNVAEGSSLKSLW